MADDLLQYVVTQLQARKGGWAEVARAVPGVSYSWVAAIGAGTYASSPSYRRLRALAEYFQANPLPAPQSATHSSAHTAADTAAGITTA
jgi:hypothetical protein